MWKEFAAGLIAPKIPFEILQDVEGNNRNVSLLNGERFILSAGEDSRVSKEKFSTLTQGILEIAQQNNVSLERLKNVTALVLERQLGLNRGIASFLAQDIANPNSVLNESLPHWIFLSITTALQFPNKYRLDAPQAVRFLPTTEEMLEHNISPQDIEDKLNTPPILTGAAVPLLGLWYDDEPGDSAGMLWPECTLLRKREGDLGTGLYSFPGGRSDALLENTAWLELLEEAPEIVNSATGERVEINIYQPEQVRFLARADQILIDRQGELRRYLANIFAFYLRTSDFIFHSKDVHSYAQEIRGVSGDNSSQEWIAAAIDRRDDSLYDKNLFSQLAPLGKISVNALYRNI